MKEITSRDNQIIKDTARLKHLKYRRQEQSFLIEGKNLFLEAVKGKQQLLRIFVEQEEAGQYLDIYRANRDTEWIIVDHALMKYICDTQTPQGIAAVARIKEWDLHDILLKPGFLLFLDGVTDPGNMGTILRTAWALGVQGIMLSRGCVDLYNPKVVRSSMGAVFHIPVFTDITIEELVKFKKQGYLILGSSLNTDVYIDQVDFSGSVIVVIGSESHGVREEIIDNCDQTFKIPIITQVDSLNAGVACGIIVYEAGKQRGNNSISR